MRSRAEVQSGFRAAAVPVHDRTYSAAEGNRSTATETDASPIDEDSDGSAAIQRDIAFGARAREILLRHVCFCGQEIVWSNGTPALFHVNVLLRFDGHSCRANPKLRFRRARIAVVQRALLKHSKNASSAVACKLFHFTSAFNRLTRDSLRHTAVKLLEVAALTLFACSTVAASVKLITG